METPKYGIFSSSVNPQKLAATVSGALKMVGALVGFAVTMGILSATDGTLLTDHFNVIAENMATIISAVYVAWGAAEACYGILRKLVVRFTA